METVAEKKRKERELLIALLLLLMDDVYDYMTAQAVLYLSSHTSIHAVQQRLTVALLGAHTQSAYYGRRLAGITAPISPQDHQFGQSAMQDQSQYLSALINDLNRRRYPAEDGKPNKALLARLLLWARRLRGTANEAWALALPPETLVYWRLGDEPEHHCTVCPERAENGPYAAHALLWHPGDGQSPCLSNCFCFLETADGQRGFTL